MVATTQRRQLPVVSVNRRFAPVVYWYVSMRCNLACKHCWVNSSPSVDTSTDLTSGELLRAADNICDFAPQGVILTGGEPLYRSDIGLLLERLVERRVKVYIETNAMLVTDEIVRLAHRADQIGMSMEFAVSLDGGDAPSHDWCRGRGSFDATIAGVRRLRAEGLTVDIQCVVNRRNWHTLKDLAGFAAEQRVQYLKFVIASPVGRANRFVMDLAIPFENSHQALQHMAEAIEDYPGEVLIKVPPAMIPPTLQPRLRGLQGSGCKVQNVTSCGFPLLGVMPDGSVTICAASSGSPEAHFGNVRDRSLVEIWAERQLDDLRDRYLAAELTGICGDCIFKQQCRGACRAHAFAETGSFDGPYPTCEEMDRAGQFPPVYRISTGEALRARMAARGSRVGRSE